MGRVLNQIRYWLIKRLGGYPMQFTPLSLPPAVIWPRQVEPQKMAVCQSVPFFVLHELGETRAVERAKRFMAQSLAETLMTENLIEIEHCDDLEMEVRIYRGTLMLVRPDEVRR